MENPFAKKESEYDQQISRLLLDMGLVDADSNEYDKMMKQLEKLRNWRVEEHTQSRVSPDTLAIVAGNVLTVLIIVAYEQKHVVTTKALGFLMRGKS